MKRLAATGSATRPTSRWWEPRPADRPHQAPGPASSAGIVCTSGPILAVPLAAGIPHPLVQELIDRTAFVSLTGVGDAVTVRGAGPVWRGPVA